LRLLGSKTFALFDRVEIKAGDAEISGAKTIRIPEENLLAIGVGVEVLAIDHGFDTPRPNFRVARHPPRIVGKH